MPLISSTRINSFFATLFSRKTGASQEAQDGVLAGVKKSNTAPTARQDMATQRTRTNNKSLFFRSASFFSKMSKSTNVNPPKTNITGAQETLEQDVNQTLTLLQKNKAKVALQAVWETSTNPNSGQEGTEYKEGFYTDFQKKVSAMSPNQLNKLYKNLNNKEMRSLRSGLQLAANKGLPQRDNSQTKTGTDGPLTEFIKSEEQKLEQKLEQKGKSPREMAWQAVKEEIKTQSSAQDQSTREVIKIPPKVKNAQRGNLVEQDVQLGMFKETSDHFAQLDSIVSEEVGKRSQAKQIDYNVPTKSLANWNGNEKTKELLQNFSTQNAPSIHADSNNVGIKLREKMQKTIEELCDNGQHKLNQKGANIGLEDPSNKKSRRLDVSNQYITDFHRMNKGFIFNDGRKTTSAQTQLLGTETDHRILISNHLVGFCHGDANQAQRVNVLMTHEAFAPIYFMQVQGDLGKHPKAGELGLEGQFQQAGLEASIDAKQMANGDIQVHLRESFQPMFYSHHEVDSKAADDGIPAKKFYIDEKKSFIVTDAIINVPKEKGAKPQLKDFTYNINITEGKQTLRADEITIPDLPPVRLATRPPQRQTATEEAISPSPTNATDL